jgi:hypothetical protein
MVKSLRFQPMISSILEVANNGLSIDQRRRPELSIIRVKSRSTRAAYNAPDEKTDDCRGSNRIVQRSLGTRSSSVCQP